MRNINQEELNKILKEHELWLKEEGGKRADLKFADLSGVNLKDVNLRYADLRYTNLSNANLRYANLRYTDFRNAYLGYADLKFADLEYADLRHADLGDTNLRYTDLNYADLEYANLREADLRCAKLIGANLKDVRTNIYTVGYHLACPKEGSFIGYKKASKCIVKLLILEDSKRSSATTIKCRCDKAKVLDIENIKTGEKIKKIRSSYDSNFIYKVGEVASVDNFDNDRWNECTTGIHFFLNKEDAINYR